MEVNKNETVYTILRSVSRSGMTRHIDCYIIRDNKPYLISYEIAETLGRTIGRNTTTGIISHGCGMDMGFELVYAYAQAKFKDGHALQQRWL